MGYTVLVHTLHFCCVPLNILSTPTSSPLLHARSERARSDLGLCARGTSSSAGIEIGVLIYAEDEMRLSSGIMMGSSAPAQLAAPHICRGGKEKASEKRWGGDGAQCRACCSLNYSSTQLLSAPLVRGSADLVAETTNSGSVSIGPHAIDHGVEEKSGRSENNRRMGGRESGAR
jgi:hypothetical protein